MKLNTKYAAAQKDYYGKGEHLYWNGIEWTANEGEGKVYKNPKRAEEVCREKGGEGFIIPYPIYF